MLVTDKWDLWRIPPSAAKEQFAVNFHAPLVLTQALISAMRSQGDGKIINVSSLGGRIPFPAAGIYSCSKFAKPLVMCCAWN